MSDFTPLPALPMMGGALDLSGPGSAPPSPPPTARRLLAKRAKAAVIVRLLLNEGADIPLEALPDDLQATLTQQMGKMGMVDRDTLGAIVAEFADELDSLGLTFPKGIAGALTALDGRISPQTAARLRKEAGVRQTGDPWVRLRAEGLDELLKLAENESVEVAAVLLSKLETGKAAELLSRLPGPLARRITYAVSQTSKVTPDAVDRIGLALAAQLEAKPDLAFDTDPVERVGEILNYSTSITRDDVLTGLDETDADFAQQVRKALFTFAHIPERVDGRDAAKITRGVDESVLVAALAYARGSEDTANAADFLLSNMSSRLADSLREMVDAAGKISRKDGEEALTAMVIAARDLAESGEITLLRPGEVEDED
ncbi:MAG: flagellar motor switch protein FliG [Rhodobiaceae bacterium]|jgi:flagellar motor switch protein FliG|nr:flagellar motor switch protein FliG [Rhodobiaceae bacterium]